MPFLTKKQIAARDLAKKMKLEKTLKPKFRLIFNKIAKQVKNQAINARETALAVNSFDEIKKTLQSHHVKVFADFDGEIAEINGVEKPDNNTKDLFVLAAIRNRDFIQRNSETSAKQITETTQKEINKSLALGAVFFRLETRKTIKKLLGQSGNPRSAKKLDELLKKTNAFIQQDLDSINEKMRQGGQFSKLEISVILDQLGRSNAFLASPFAKEEMGEKSESIFKERSEGRIEIIAITETQGAAESSKLSEAKNLRLLGLIAFLNKTWNNVGDDRVRDSHVEAGGQTVPIDQPFIVGGALLNHPRDTSLGAPAEEVVGCRCWLTFN